MNSSLHMLHVPGIAHAFLKNANYSGYQINSVLLQYMAILPAITTPSAQHSSTLFYCEQGKTVVTVCLLFVMNCSNRVTSTGIPLLIVTDFSAEMRSDGFNILEYDGKYSIYQ